MKTMIRLFALAGLISLSAFQAQAGCILHITDMDSILTREGRFEIHQLAQKNGIYLKLNASDLRNGDYVINNLVNKAEYGNPPYIRDEQIMKSRWVFNYYYELIRQSNEVGRDYSRNMMVAVYQNGSLQDVATQKLDYKVQYADFKSEIKENPDFWEVKVPLDIFKKVISDFKCGK